MPTLEQLQAEISDLREKMQRLDAETDKWVGRMMASPWTWLIALGLFAIPELGDLAIFEPSAAEIDADVVGKRRDGVVDHRPHSIPVRLGPG